MTKLTSRQRLYQIIFGTSTRFGQWFDIALIIAIVSSELILIISSVASNIPIYLLLLNGHLRFYSLLNTSYVYIALRAPLLTYAAFMVLSI